MCIPRLVPVSFTLPFPAALSLAKIGLFVLFFFFQGVKKIQLAFHKNGIKFIYLREWDSENNSHYKEFIILREWASI